MVSYLKQGRAFYRQVAALALPLVLQNIITSSVAMADTFMVGLLSTVDLAGVTIANIPFFVVQLFFFGVQSGGTVLIRSYETESHFCVEVRDDGVGFDTNAPIDSKKHVGLRNIRGRLKAMVNGELILQSEEGVGTKALIMIPKEVTL